MLRAYFSRLPLTDRVTHWWDLWAGLATGVCNGGCIAFLSIAARRAGVSDAGMALMLTMPYLGALLMLAAVGLHAFANYLLLPAAATDPSALLAVYRYRFIALLAMLSSSVVTVGGALLLWLKFAGHRRGPK